MRPTVGCGPTRRQIMTARPWLMVAAAVLVAASSVVTQVLVFANDDHGATPPLDPAGWGNDHVGKPLPEYVTGDECLFCHRDIGPGWPENRHQLTVRPAANDDPDLVRILQLVPALKDDIQFLLGDQRSVRILKRSEAYGKLDLHSAKYFPALDPQREGTIENRQPMHWNQEKFGQQCAGCHATAVETETRAFAATSIDCFACHGSVDLAHTKDPKVALLSKQNQPPEVVISICGQCHLRGGKSESSGLPYPNTFVAGDNLFRDYRVDLSEKAISKLSAIDRHIFENTRDVVVSGRTETTCLSCHDVHAQSTDKHQALNDNQRCTTCHVPDSDNTRLRKSLVESRGRKAHNTVCDY